MLARVHRFFDSVLVWGLVRAFNPSGLRSHGLWHSRIQIWMSRRKFIGRYGGRVLEGLEPNAGQFRSRSRGEDLDASLLLMQEAELVSLGPAVSRDLNAGDRNKWRDLNLKQKEFSMTRNSLTASSR